MAITSTGSNLVNKNLIAPIFSKEVQTEYEKTAVAQKIINTKSTKPLKQSGDTLTFRVIGSLLGQLQDYSKNGTTSWTDLPDDKVVFTINNAKTLAIKVDDIDEAQNDIKNVLKLYGERAGYAVADNFDQYVLSKYAGAGSTYGASGSEIDVGYDTDEVSPLNVLARMGRLLDDENAPSRGRYAVIPPAFKEVMMNESSKFIDASVMGTGKSAALNGYFTNYCGFDLYVSNNLSATTNGYACLFGVPDAMIGCQQIVKSETLRLENSWADGWRTLSVYDAMVYQSEGLACAYLKFD